MKNLVLLVLVALGAQAQATSIGSVVAGHSAAMKKQDRTAYLFDVMGVLIEEAGQVSPVVYASAFATPGNLITYTQVATSSEEGVPFYFEERKFVPGRCGGVGCTPPPGKPEPVSGHPRINSWKVDVQQLGGVLKSLGVTLEEGAGFRLTTAGRLRHQNFVDSPLEVIDVSVRKAFSHVPAGTPVFRIVTRNLPEQLCIFIDANSGKIITRGKYRLLPPPPGAVSSGG